MQTGQTDGRTPFRHITLSAVDAPSVIHYTQQTHTQTRANPGENNLCDGHYRCNVDQYEISEQALFCIHRAVWQHIKFQRRLLSVYKFYINFERSVIVLEITN